MSQAIDALREIFVVALLPDRKLRFFEEQPLARVPPGREGDRVLLQYVVEDAMKRRCAPATQISCRFRSVNREGVARVPSGRKGSHPLLQLQVDAPSNGGAPIVHRKRVFTARGHGLALLKLVNVVVTCC